MFHVWKNRYVRGSQFFLASLILAAIWIIAQGLELAAITPDIKLFWAKIQYVPSSFAPIIYFMFTLQAVEQDLTQKRKRILSLLLIIPLAMNILVWADGSSGLILRNIRLRTDGPFPSIEYNYGPFFWIFAANTYLTGLLTVFHLIRAYLRKSAYYKRQYAFLLAAIVLPYVSSFLYIFKISPSAYDFTPPVFGLSALLIAFGIYRYRLFEVIPIAHSIIIREMRTGMAVLNNEGIILEINPAAIKMLHLPAGHYTGQPLNELADIPGFRELSGSDTVLEIAMPYGGADYFYELSVKQIRNAKKGTIGQLLQIYDITALKLSEEAALSAAQTDPLTGTLNRNQFEAHVSAALKNAATRGERLTIAFLDLDDFKHINDTFGHNAGDHVIKTVARRLKDNLRESDLISRFGGDEFTLALLHLGDSDNIRQLGNKLINALEKDIELGNGSGTAHIRASIGFSVYPKDGESFETLLKKADTAMYASKRSRRPGYHIYGE
jgi:diguanylate cyclase (GGDEF)-like protein